MHIAESEEDQFTGILPSIGDVGGAAQSGRYRRRIGDVAGAAQSAMRAPADWYREKAFDIVQRYWKNHSPQERRNWLMTLGIRMSWDLLSMKFDDLPDEEFEEIVDNIQSMLEEDAAAEERGPATVGTEAQSAMRYSAIHAKQRCATCSKVSDEFVFASISKDLIAMRLGLEREFTDDEWDTVLSYEGEFIDSSDDQFQEWEDTVIDYARQKLTGMGVTLPDPDDIKIYSSWVGLGGSNDKILTKTMFALFEAEVKRGWNESVENRKKVLESVKDISGLSLPMFHALSRWEELSKFTREQIMLALMQGLAMAGEQAKKAQAAALVDDYEYSAAPKKLAKCFECRKPLRHGGIISTGNLNGRKVTFTLCPECYRREMPQSYAAGEGGLSAPQLTIFAGFMLLVTPLLLYAFSKR